MPDYDFDCFTAIDVETPNRYSRSICSIGIVHVQPGMQPVRLHYLVNPEDDFDGMNIRIHGIRPSDVEDAPSIPQLWDEIGRWFSGGLLLAHNALFDLPVVKRSLERYEMFLPELRYVCTLQKARKHIPKYAFGSHRLNVLCEGLGIPLERHHNALDDALACAELYEYLKTRYGCDGTDLKRFR
jgi:DNA polymerase-3 subunit epsilon